MSEQQTTSVVKQEDAAKPAAPALPTSIQQKLDERKALNAVVAKISEMNWGKGLDPIMQKAVAFYLRENALDVTEVNVLGGNIYRNSLYWKRRLSEMIDNDEVEYAKPDFITEDPRLKVAAEHPDEATSRWAIAEDGRRLRERIAYGVPEDALAACVFRVKLKKLDHEFAAAKAIQRNDKSDPVGQADPVDTVISRACRKVMSFIAAKLPHLAAREAALVAREEDVAVELRTLHERAAVREQQLAEASKTHALTGTTEGWQYPGLEAEPQPVVTVPAPNAGHEPYDAPVPTAAD